MKFLFGYFVAVVLIFTVGTVAMVVTETNKSDCVVAAVNQGFKAKEIEEICK